MKLILIIILSIIGIGLFWHFTTKKFISPYKLLFYFGKKGCGKSTLLTKIAYENLKKGKSVYSTEDLAFTVYNRKTRKKDVLKTIPFEPSKIYTYTFPVGSVILIDECSLLWSNRDFASMPKQTIAWFQLQRKYQVTVHLFSVSFSIDKKLRELCDEMYLCTKVLRVWSIARHVIRKPIIVHPQGDSPASIQDDIVEDGILLAPFGGMRITFIPYWVKFFDSFKVNYSFLENKK